MKQTRLIPVLIEDRRLGMQKGVVVGGWMLLGVVAEGLLRRHRQERYAWCKRRVGSEVFEQVGKWFGSGL
jgi:hypothetical protein